jgi:putative transposase
VNRRKSELQSIDLAQWPTVAYTEFDSKSKAAFQTRMLAVQQYANGRAIKGIELEHGINRRQLYRWLERALAQHDDGRINGYRGLISGVRFNRYERLNPVVIRGEQGSRGAAGAFSYLLERYPALSAWLALQVKRRKVLLEQIHTDGALRTRVSGLTIVHREFLQQCRSVGLTASDYPFNTEDRAIRVLSRRLKGEMLRNFGVAAHSAGATRLKGLPRSDDVMSSPTATRPYQVVEFDGHRLDIRLKVVIPDPLGFEHEFEIERVWLLVIIDVCTRAVLGYNLVLGREYSRYDVIKTIENTLEPHRSRTFTIPGLSYGPQEGFPSERLLELGYATWEWIKLDNAKANLANETLSALCDFVGCCVDAGPRHSPDERPYIERFFGTVHTRFSSRLPGYTGSHPRDLRRALSAPKGGLRLFVSFDELEELIEYSIANYNGTPHGGLNNVTPLEAMEYFIRGRQSLVTWLAEHHRRTLCLMQTARRSRVRAYLELGVRPHINLYGARYTNALLASSAHLVGRQLLVYINSDDLRSVRAFLPDGAELGILEAQGMWRIVPHNLKLRREIRKGSDTRRYKGEFDSNPIESYLKEKLAQAKHTRKAATELALVMRALETASVVRSPAGPPKANDTGGDVVVAASLEIREMVGREVLPVPIANARRLSIGTGQVF